MIIVSWSKQVTDNKTSSKVDRFMNANCFYEPADFNGDIQNGSVFQGPCIDSEYEICGRKNELGMIVGHEIDIVLTD